MLELLQLGPEDKLFEIGTGSGFLTEAFAQTGAEIHSIGTGALDRSNRGDG